MKFKIFFISIILAIFLSKSLMAEPKSTGKYKNWQSFVTQTDKGKICFAQTVPVKRAPKNIKRQESRLFVTFRPGEDVKAEAKKFNSDQNAGAFTHGEIDITAVTNKMSGDVTQGIPLTKYFEDAIRSMTGYFVFLSNSVELALVSPHT